MAKKLTPRGEAAPPVEPIITGATLPPRPSGQKAIQAKKEAEPGAVYIRNLHHIRARVTLNSGREINLMPRGQREDMDIVNADEQEDPKFLANLDLIFEILDVTTAKTIIAKQQHNARTAEHPLWEHLRNPKGEAYDQRVARVEEVFERQGYVIGRVSETGPTGAHISKGEEITRVSHAGPQIVEAPGSPGHPATEVMLGGPDYISPEMYHEFLQWKRFKEAMAAEKATTEESQDAAPVKKTRLNSE